jgi:hypothetical protein
MFGSLENNLEKSSDRNRVLSYFLFFFFFALICIISTSEITPIPIEELPFINP